MVMRSLHHSHNSHDSHDSYDSHDSHDSHDSSTRKVIYLVEIVRRGLGQGLQGQAYIWIMVVAMATNFIKGVSKKEPNF